MKLFVFMVLFSSFLGAPVQELYQLQRYEEVLLSVNDQSTIEEKTFKGYSLYHLQRYKECYEYVKGISGENKSDSLKCIYAISAYELGLDEEFILIEESIASQAYKDRLLQYSFPEIEHLLNSRLFSPTNNNGFCFVGEEILKAVGNKLLLGDKEILEWKGKYVAYPFVKGSTIIFSANEFSGSDMKADDLAKISRSKISKLQLFSGKFENGVISDVKKLNFCSIEYDYVTPFIDDAGNVYFATNALGGYGGYDLYRSEITGTGYEIPQNLGMSFNSKYNEVGYVETIDRAYFSSEKEAVGRLDLITCMRNSRMYSGFVNLGLGVNSRTSESNLQVKGSKGYYNQALLDGTVQIKVIDDLRKLSKASFLAVSEKTGTGIIVSSYDNDFGNGNKLNSKVNDSLVNTEIDDMFYSNYTFHSYGYMPEVVKSDDLKAVETLNFKPNFEGIIEDYITGEPLEGVGVFAIKGTDTIKRYTGADGSWWHAVEENDGWKIVVDKTGYKQRVFENEKVSANALKSVSMGMDTKKGTKLEIRNIYFAYGKADIEKESIEVLDRIVEYMVENPLVRFELSAHTDSRGSDQVNLKLSNSRAQSAYNYLVSKGISKERLVPKGYGEKEPVNRCTNGVNCSEEEFQLNRRVEIEIL